MNIDIKINKIKIVLALVCLGLVLYILLKPYFQDNDDNVPFPNVVIQKPQSKKMREYITQTGTMVSFQSVDLVARIEGFLEKIEFVDGTFVDKGTELFQIEPKPYLEKLKAAVANLAGKKASYKYSQIEYDRQKRMYKKNATSLNNVQLWEAKTAEAKASVSEARSQVTLASIDYSYTHVLAPFTGRIGRHLVDVGNLVGSGKPTTLATIEQIDPIYVYFNLNELDLIKILAAARKRNFDPKNIKRIPVKVKMQSENKFLHKGTLDFVNTGLNASTGTLEFRALLSNPKYVLLPGLFVQVRVPISDPIIRVVIPDMAILYDQSGAYVYTVTSDNIVKQVRVELGGSQRGQRVIVKGITKEDSIIVAGMHNATPGRQVVPVQQEKNNNDF
ncbi:MAG: efflux RND transporter periplasmic adaptor subunit [Legionellaceae bacterium]|nr:efflux RND transporter periplasmic adaptor subunit [Legionellaceae bacterium]